MACPRCKYPNPVKVTTGHKPYKMWYCPRCNHEWDEVDERIIDAPLDEHVVLIGS